MMMIDNYHNISSSSVRGDLSDKSNSDTNDGCNPSEIINMIIGTEKLLALIVINTANVIGQSIQ